MTKDTQAAMRCATGMIAMLFTVGLGACDGSKSDRREGGVFQRFASWFFAEHRKPDSQPLLSETSKVVEMCLPADDFSVSLYEADLSVIPVVWRWDRILALLVMVWLAFRCRSWLDAVPVVIYARTTRSNLLKRILDHCPSLVGHNRQPTSGVVRGHDDHRSAIARSQAVFRPHPLLRLGHLQTLMVGLWPLAPRVRYMREFLRMSDGGTVAIDWTSHGVQQRSEIGPHGQRMESAQCQRHVPVLVVLHGLTGGSHEAYVRRLVDWAHRQYGWRAAVINYRGCNGVPLTTPQSYSAGWTDDVRAVVKHVHDSLPDAPLCIAGFSLGANITVKYVGEEGRSGVDCPVVAACAVGSPFNCIETDRHMNRRSWVQQVYNTRLAANIKKVVASHHALWQTLAGGRADEPQSSRLWLECRVKTPIGSAEVCLKDVMAATTVRHVDEQLTRRVFGFASVDDYYRAASCDQWLCHVKVPLLCLSAMDDPICVSSALPFDQCVSNSNVALVTTEKGGHLGWFQAQQDSSSTVEELDVGGDHGARSGAFAWARNLLRVQQWSVKPVMEFLAAAVDEHRLQTCRQE